MLKITADLYSGRANPEWIISDEQEIRATLREIANNASVIAKSAPANAGLGLRGFLVEPLNDELGRNYNLSESIYLAAGQYAISSKANAIAERLVGLMNSAEITTRMTPEEEALSLDADLQGFLQEQLYVGERLTLLDTEGLELSPEAVEIPLETPKAACQYELGAYNPSFWNNNATILRNNNCYNYASNKRTDTFAQPGRGCGSMYRSLTCAEVTRASLCDGLHVRYNCFPASEAPRYLVALVIAPGRDFHWYRLNKEGFWSHKPGSTPVRNVDNSNRVITNPETCNRGIYTQFCGYFYTCKSQKIR